MVHSLPLYPGSTTQPAIAKSASMRKRVIWESGPLTMRDLCLKSGPNTNLTGSMLFKKGSYEVDQRVYFRNECFGSLNWNKDDRDGKEHIERTYAKFAIVIQGKYRGEWELLLSHDSRIDCVSYQQGNSMTKISWGTAKKVIAHPYLLGKRIKLYKQLIGKDTFLIEFF